MVKKAAKRKAKKTQPLRDSATPMVSAKVVCGAQKRNKLDGDLCQSTKVMANGRCRIHGGKTRKASLSAILFATAQPRQN